TGKTDGNGKIDITVPKDSVKPGDQLTVQAGNGAPGTVTVPTDTPTTGVTITKTPDGGYQVGGKTKPDTTVTVTDNNGNPIKDGNGNPVTGTTDGNGNIDVKIPSGTVTPGQTVIIDPNGGTKATVTVPADTTTPTTGVTITKTPDGGYQVGGKTKPNTTVTVTDNNGNPIKDGNGNPVTGTTDGNGNIDVKIPGGTVTPGQTVIIDPNGGTKATVTVPADTTTPTTGVTITKTPDGGYQVGGKTKPNTTVTVTDNNGNPIKDGNGNPVTGTTDGDGNIDVKIPSGTVTPGQTVIIDPNGGTKATVTVPADTTTPTTGVTITKTPDGGYQVGGKTKPNTTVTVTDNNGNPIKDGNGNPVTGTTDGDGNIDVKIPSGTVTPGQTVIIDPNGGTKATVTVPADTTTPTTGVTITKTPDGGYQVGGKTKPNTTVTVTDNNGNPIKDGNGNPVTGTTDGNGNIDVKIPSGVVTPGQTVIIDPNGGTKATVTVPADTTTPTTGVTITKTPDGGYQVGGKTKPDTTVTVTDSNGNPIKDGNGNPVTGTTDGDGNIDVKLPSGTVTPGQTIEIDPNGGTSVTITVPNDTGNTPTGETKTPTTDVKITPDDNGNYTVTGKTTPNTNVVITNGAGNSIASGKSDGNGNFTVPIDNGSVKPGETLSVTPDGGTTVQVLVPNTTTNNHSGVNGNNNHSAGNNANSGSGTGNTNGNNVDGSSTAGSGTSTVNSVKNVTSATGNSNGNHLEAAVSTENGAVSGLNGNHSSKDTGKLPQTGEETSEGPILIILGEILAMFGIAIKSRKRKDEK
ncbi:Ig-like domain-containing protein, partial [Secundilactobacillus folii]